MSKTYRKNSDGTWRSDGGKNYASPRYQSGSRRKPHHIVAKATRRNDVDMDKFGQIIIESALMEAQREAEVQREAERKRRDEGGNHA